MPDFYVTLGRIAYAAYADHRGGLTHDDKPMPAWENLGEGIQGAWEAAARASLRFGMRPSQVRPVTPGGD